MNVIISPIEQARLDNSELTYEQYLEILQGLSEAEMVDELASLFLRVDEIEDIIGYELGKLKEEIQDPNSVLGRAYRHGVARTKLRLRLDTMQFALSGSPQAAEEMKEYLSDQMMSENA